MKILHVIPSLSETEGGPTYAVKSLAAALVAAGHNVTIATTGEMRSGDCGLRSSGASDPGYNVVAFLRNFAPYKISFGLAKWLRHNVTSFDIVHIHALFSFSSFAAARAARKQGVPYIVRPLGVLNRWGMETRRPFLKRVWLRFIELPLMAKAAAIHYTTEKERCEAELVCPELKRNRALVIPIPLKADGAGGSPQEFVNRFPAATGKRIILFLSRIDPKKGLEILLKAFATILKTEGDVLLVIAGAGDEKYVTSLNQLADRLGIAGRIVWAGLLGDSDKASAFAAATVFVLPSYSENFGIAAAEALAAGVPSILSDGVALAHDVAAYDAAVIVPAEESAISSALLRILGDADLRESLKKNGRMAATKLFSSRSIGIALSAEYERIRRPTAAQ